ncbi:hypothetical protein [Phyllobacterium ifriqiyense]|uniref:hypothetical protein n=1 Tax=Phyllobacterium ifriqiyense TaxID=314238 RepID=UPI003397DDB6
MAYNVVSSAAGWMRNRLASRLLGFVAGIGKFKLHAIAGRETERGEWNGLEPFDLLHGWNGPEAYPDEKK